MKKKKQKSKKRNKKNKILNKKIKQCVNIKEESFSSVKDRLKNVLSIDRS